MKPIIFISCIVFALTACNNKQPANQTAVANALDTVAVLTGINPIKTSNSSAFTLVQNPVSDYLHIKIADEDVYANSLLGIYDITGKLQLEQPVQSNTEKVAVGWLPEGVYLLKLRSGQQQTTSRFIRAK